jgi:hypothetical protein
MTTPPRLWTYVGILVLIATPVLGQPVTFADLDGFTIESEVVRDQMIRRGGWQGSMKVHANWRMVIGPGEAIDMQVVSTVEGPRGKRTGKPRGGMLTLGKAQQLRGQGGGHGVFEFQDGTLTFVRTFPQGAYRGNFELVRSPNGINCTMNEAFARERGVGGIVLHSAVDGKPFTLISSKQVSSSCKVVKTK